MALLDLNDLNVPAWAIDMVHFENTSSFVGGWTHRMETPAFFESWPHAAAMAAAPHDPVYHAEGSPWVHTLMVMRELLESQMYHAAKEAEQLILRLAVLYHDVAKPITVKVEYDEDLKIDRIRNPMHAPIGARIAYRDICAAGFPEYVAKMVYLLIYWHQRPGHMSLSNPEDTHRFVEFVEDAGWGWWQKLIGFCCADTLGRTCPGQDESVAHLYDILRNYGSGEHTLKAGLAADGHWAFEDASHRLGYLATPRKRAVQDGPMPYNPRGYDGAAVVLMGQGYENGPLPDSLDGHFRTYARVHLSADENGKIHGPRAERLLKDGYRVLVTIPFCKVEDRAGLMLSLRRTGHMIIAMMCEAPDESWPLGDPFQKREAHYAFSKDCAKNVAVKDVIHLFDPQ